MNMISVHASIVIMKHLFTFTEKCGTQSPITMKANLQVLLWKCEGHGFLLVLQAIKRTCNIWLLSFYKTTVKLQ
jgi:hypothetical protein